MTARQLAQRGQYVPAGERVIPQAVTAALQRYPRRAGAERPVRSVDRSGPAHTSGARE